MKIRISVLFMAFLAIATVSRAQSPFGLQLSSTYTPLSGMQSELSVNYFLTDKVNLYAGGLYNPNSQGVRLGFNYRIPLYKRLSAGVGLAWMYESYSSKSENITQTYSQFELPLRLDYQLNDRWSIHSGFGLSIDSKVVTDRPNNVLRLGVGYRFRGK
jgi:opacity protein-like surface antigen